MVVERTPRGDEMFLTMIRRGCTHITDLGVGRAPARPLRRPMLTPFDDYPVHQTPLPIAHAGGGHPDHYDRFWFNGYTEGLLLSPSRSASIPTAASSTRRSVSSTTDGSGRCSPPGGCRSIPTRTEVGPISIEITDPLRVNRIRWTRRDLGIHRRPQPSKPVRRVRRAPADADERHQAAQDVTRLAQMANGPAPSACREARSPWTRPPSTGPRTAPGAFRPVRVSPPPTAPS